MPRISRRNLLKKAAIGSTALSLPLVGSCTNLTNGAETGNGKPAKDSSSATSERKDNFFVLNTSTIMGYNLPIEDEISVAAEAGYDGIEVWMSKIYQFREKGGNLTDLKKLISDRNLKLVNAISFPAWITDDEEKRTAAVEQMKAEMEILAELGCPHIAAPPIGATEQRMADLEQCGKRYRAILEAGESIGVIPLLEMWGASATLSKLEDAIAIAVAAQHPKASILLDAYHFYRGGNSVDSLLQLSGNSVKLLHLNDYPAVPEREKLTDGDRVLPGDGVCPTKTFLGNLKVSGFCGAIS
ncbi:MAG: sugar phosphate isomerase/epimerase family protein, partial [Thermoguttaceae bacterium]